MRRTETKPDSVMHLVPALFDSRDGVVGGAERYVLELARHMADVVPTRLVTFGDCSRHERTGALDVRVIGHPWFVRGQRSNPVSRSLLGEVRRAEVVHCHQQHVAASSLCAAWGRLIGRKVFCTDLGGGGWDVSAYVSTDRWYNGHLHISEYSRRVSGHNGVHRARVVFGGVDTDRFCPGANVSRDGTIVFVGRLLPHKGINDLLDALEPGMRAEIIGTVADDRHVADLKARASGKDVRFRPNCDDASVIDAYRRATCVVLPSVYVDMYGHETRVPELLGQTLLEGMACGAPAVCTDVASLPEVVEHGTTGLVVPPNDPAALREALRWRLANTEAAAAMGTRARARVIERFSWSGVVDRCLEAYAA